jgi:mono/diheme cytochrome c family protein
LTVNWGFALTIGFVAALAPAMAQAQTNIDQGKSASQLFGNSCAECHKVLHALAKGKSTAAVAQFLSEHYTTGRDQAAALAIYVTSGRDTVASPVPGRKPSPGEAANAKPRRHGEAEATSTGGSMMNPIGRPEPAQRDKPGMAGRNRRPGTPETPQEPSAVAHEAPRAEPIIAPAQDAPTSAVAPSAPAPTPAEAPAAQSGEAGLRDNIPD